MKNSKFPIIETLILLIGEIIVSAVICGVYLLINKFSYKVITGVALGTAVTVLNFIILAISTSRAFDNALLARGTRQMSDEEAEQFASEHQKDLSNAVKLSFIIRNFTMLAALVLAFILDTFDVIATLIPLLLMKPILIVGALIKQKLGKDDV